MNVFKTTQSDNENVNATKINKTKESFSNADYERCTNAA